MSPPDAYDQFGFSSDVINNSENVLLKNVAGAKTFPTKSLVHVLFTAFLLPNDLKYIPTTIALAKNRLKKSV
jgi:hypothetical protein